jgi:uncharacterized membrane protein YjjP (DUF1212 family)
MDRRENKVLLLAVRAGELMLANGAEVYRVENAVVQVSQACGLPYVDCFATPTGIFVTIGQEGPEAERDTIIRRVKHSVIDLEKVAQVSAFIKRLEADEPSIDEGLRELERIDRVAPFSLLIRLAAMVLIGVFFTLMNKGDYVDGICGLVVAVFTYLLSLGIERLSINRFISIFVSCFFAAGLSLLFFNLGFGSSLSSVITGAITSFLPGVAITNGTRDLLYGDMLSGVSRVAEAFLIAVAIAGGAGVLLRLAPAQIDPDILTMHSLPWMFLFAILGTIGMSILINIPRRYLVVTGIIAAGGWVTFETIVYSGGSMIIGCFVGACVLALLSEVATRITKAPSTLFIIPTIFPLVPGIGMYNTMLNLVNGNFDAALSVGAQALFMAGGIAFAILVISSLGRIATVIFGYLRRRPA